MNGEWAGRLYAGAGVGVAEESCSLQIRIYLEQVEEGWLVSDLIPGRV